MFLCERYRYWGALRINKRRFLIVLLSWIPLPRVPAWDFLSVLPSLKSSVVQSGLNPEMVKVPFSGFVFLNGSFRVQYCRCPFSSSESMHSCFAQFLLFADMKMLIHCWLYQLRNGNFSPL